MIKPVLKILVVEDELIISETLRQMLLDIGHQCSAVANDFEEGVFHISQQNFDPAILDVNLAGRHNGIHLGKECSKLGKPFFFLTSYSDYETVQAAKVAKPGAYLVKPFTPEDILVAIEMTMMHSNTVSESQFESFLESLMLSEREIDVLRCLKDQMTNADIANKLFVSKDTIKFHVKNLYLKLGINSRIELLTKMKGVSQAMGE
uniref:response regulator transcription factor n=1 Tax=Roseivirga sp. TaxID=1964215 RepID=UPI0040472478